MADESNQSGAAEAYQNLLKKHNDDANAVALKLFGENYDYRNEIRELKKQIPATGAKVITAEQEKEFEALQALGMDAAKAKEAIERAAGLETENAKLQRRDKFRSIEMLGNRLDVLEAGMEAFPTAEITIKKQKDASEPAKEVLVPYVSLDGKESSLADFEKEHFPKHLAPLKDSNEQKQITPGNPASPNGHSPTGSDVLKNEMAILNASGNYSL